MKKPILVLFAFMVFYVGFIAYSDFNNFYLNLSAFRFEFLPLILTVSFLGMLIKSLRQQVFLKKIKVNISLKENILLFLSGLSMIVTPAGSGELIKTYFLKTKYGYKPAKTFPLVIIERFHDLLALITIVTISLSLTEFTEAKIIVIIVMGFLLIVYIAIRIKKLFLKIIKILGSIKKLHKFIESITESYSGLYELTSKQTMAKGWSISMVGWSMDVIVVYLVFVAFDTDLDILYTTMVVFSSVLFGAISFLPGGIGVTEISVVQFLTQKGLEISFATTIMVMIRLVTIWFATVLGFITARFFLRK